MTIHDILLTQSREQTQLLSRQFIEREEKIEGITSNLIHLISGPRRSGKSSFGLWQCRDLHAGYVNFDDERLLSLLKEMDDIIGAIMTIYHNPNHIFMDEIQNVPGWELMVNRLSRQGFRLILSGSNAHLLSSELATHLTGRYTQTCILPFSFSEYLTIHPITRTENEIQEQLLIYNETGGFPEPLLTDINRVQYTNDLIDAVLYKDIIRRFSIRNPVGIGDLTSYLYSTVGSEFSMQNLARISQVKSVNTVRKYLEYLEMAYLVFSVPRFSYKYREQLAYNKKIYAYDNGFVTSRGFLFSENKGRLYENLVAITLRKKEILGDISLYFWKNQEQEEVDFVIKRGRDITALIQVCATITRQDTFTREIRALLKARRELHCDTLILLTESESGEEEHSWHEYTGMIRKIPLKRWLINPGI